MFADSDTRALAHSCIRLPATRLGFDPDRLLEALARPGLRGLPLVYGAGFEEDPTLLARIALVLQPGLLLMTVVEAGILVGDADHDDDCRSDGLGG